MELMQQTNVQQRNNVKVFGKGEKALIFAHGFGCDQNMWRYVVSSFQQNFKIVLYDHVGAGQSDTSAYDFSKYATLQGYADDLIEICEYLALEQPIFVGHSVGAIIGVLSAKRKPDLFEKLVLVGPSPSYVNEDEYYGGFDLPDLNAMLGQMEDDFTGWAGNFGPFIMGNPDRPSLGEELTYSFCSTDSEIAQHFARVVFLSDNRMDLPLVKTKTLIIQCSQDMIAPTEVGAYMHQHLTNSTLVTLKADGHCPHLSAPLETIAAMEPFLLN